MYYNKMADFLDEDSQVYKQKYAVFSYTVPGADPKGKRREGGNFPMFKIRGSYETIEECEKRIKDLQKADKYFHMFIVEVGKWGCLMSEEELRNQDVDAKYQNEAMNELVKGYKENKDKNDIEFEKRKEWMKQKAIQDGTPEGQAILAGQKEHYISVKNRLDQSTEHIAQLYQQLKEVQEIYDSAREKIQSYTPEEIEGAEKELGKLKIE